MSRMPDTVQDIVDRHLCTQCGTCVAVCPVGAIEMRETPAGLLCASVLAEKCVACGKCRELCPGAFVDVSLPEGVDPFKGQVCRAYVGHACDEAVRSTGQSGGVVSALLLYLFETDRIDAALVTTMPADGSLRPRPMLARTRQEILASQGSKYCPVAANTALRGITPSDHVAAVGISCQMHGIHRLAQHRTALAAGIQYRIGLFCSHTLLYASIDQMSRDAGINMEEIAGLEYRSKARNGWPGEVCFRLRSGENRFFPTSLRSSLKDSCTTPRCRLCFDQMNIFSDLSVGDPWYISKSPKGESVVIARNDKGVSLLQDACRDGLLELREIDAETVFEAQAVERRRRNFAAFSDVWRGMGRSLPEYRGMAPRFLAPVDSAVRAVCSRILLLNCRVAGSKTRQSALASARRSQRIARLKALLLKPFVKLPRSVKHVLRSAMRIYEKEWRRHS